MSRSRIGGVMLMGALGACGPEWGPISIAEDSTTTSEGVAGSTSTDLGSGSSSSGSSGLEVTSTSGPVDTGAGLTGLGFLSEPDAGGADFRCDMFAQNCPPGEKCMPWANDGGNSWNATRCSPIADDPGEPGDACMVEGSGTSGIDDCRLGAMCWDVDPKTNIGTCVAMCTGDESNPFCEDPDTTCPITGDGAILLCLPICDPIQQDCVEGEACYPIIEAWMCAPDASGDTGAYGDPCEFINVCDPGLICLSAETVPAGEACEDAAGCCTEVCDLADATGDAQCSGAAGGQTCQAWYEEGSAPPGYEDVGACALPA